MYESITTPADLDALPTPAILSMYNHLTGKATKKFHSRGKGVEQTFRALQYSRTDAAPKVTKPVVERDTSAVIFRKRAGRAGRLDLNQTIEIVQEENPKRPGSRAFRQYERLLTFDGRTVQEFIDAENDIGPKGWTRAELIWSEKKGFIGPITKG